VGAIALAAAIALLARQIASETPTALGLGLAGLAVVALAFTLEEPALPKMTQAVGTGVALIGLGAFVDPDTRLRLFSFASAASGVGLALRLAVAARKTPRLSLGLAALYAAALAGLSAYAAFLVLASRDLMSADFMTYRSLSMMVARLLGAGEWPLLASAAGQSITQDYAWGPALVPGLALALTQPTSRAVYAFALLALYAAPALFALAVLARDLARRAGLRPEGGLVLAVAAVFAAYPAGMAVAARGMPDVGGVVLAVCALRLSDRLARLLALGQGHDARIAPMTHRVALALALTMFSMFAFRRWYAFAAAGIAIVLAIELASIAVQRRARFRWKDAVASAALGVLGLLALASPVIVDWLPNLGAHDYADLYAAYRKPPDVFLRQLCDWVGLVPALAAIGGAAFLMARSPNRRLLRLTLGSATIAAALFLRIQTPYIHHLYLIAPAIAAPIAGALMLVFARASRAALLGLVGLGAITLTPLAAALNPLGLTPIAGLPRAPRADLDELYRLKDWVDQRARPDAKVCGLGSSYTFSGQLIGELWQLRPAREIAPKPKTDVKMPDVDAVDGPPTSGFKDCATIIVGDPVQTHLNPDDQQTVVVPSREMLTGQGIGAKFRRTGEVFRLENGVSAIVFERITPLDDADIAALRSRWRAAGAGRGLDGSGMRQ
jgi:hypothetical protein